MAIAEIITIGNEILDGRVTDTNRVFVGRRLKSLGFEVKYAQSVDDHTDRIVDALHLAATRSDVVVCTGGLGPTSDDLSSEAAAKFFRCDLEINPAAEKFLRDLFAKRKRELNESQLKQAKLPKYCQMISNPIGTAPGFFFRGKVHTAGAGTSAGLIKEINLYFFPGVPKELYLMFEASIPKDFSEKNITLKSYTWSTLFTSEGELQEKLRPLEKEISPFRLGFRTHFPENHVSLMGRAETADLEDKWKKAVEKLSHTLAHLSFHQGVEIDYETLLLNKLIAKDARLIFVESCTGGLLSHLLSDVPGASNVFWGSQVCYANEEKFRLGISKDSVKTFGAVSEQCAKEMALAGLERLKLDTPPSKYLVSLSTTGIAGPSGGSEMKPVGLMYMTLVSLHVGTNTVSLLSEKIEAPQFFERKAMKLYMAKKALEFLRVNFLSH